MSGRVTRVVVAGQVPPPWGGQNVMVAQALDSLRADSDLEILHLAFHFTRDWQAHRRIGLGKVWELIAVILRLIRIRLSGRIDCMLFPFGGPHVAPLVRDMALLPFCFAASRQVMLHIHAGGMAEALPELPGALARLAPLVYGRCTGAIVLTEYSRADAESVGIRNIHVVPNTLPDTYSLSFVNRPVSEKIRLLAVGHLGVPKGTPTLLRAVAGLRDRGHEISLTLIGEPLPPYSANALAELIRALDLGDVVDVAGVVIGEGKWRAFGSADLFVFPSTAPESQPLVLIEAMMWGLPIVATDWRAHAEILGVPPGGICYPPEPGPALERALETAIAARDLFGAWGEDNRRRYEQLFDAANPHLRRFVERWCTSASSTN